jgi:hypothetical protein
VGTSSKNGVVTFFLTDNYYLKHKEVLDNFMMKGTSTCNDRQKEDLITWVNYSPVGGWIKIKNDPAFLSFLRLTGGL